MRLSRLYQRQRLALAMTLIAALLVQVFGQYLHLSGHDHSGVGDSALVIESHHHLGADCVDHPDHDRGLAFADRVEPGCDHEPSHAERCALSWLWHQIFEPGEGQAVAITAIDAARFSPPLATADHSSVPLFRLAPKQSPPHVG